MLDVHFVYVSDVGRGAFVELESREDVKLALSRSIYATICGRVLGKCSSSMSVNGSAAPAPRY